jgi:hypothetical protein
MVWVLPPTSVLLTWPFPNFTDPVRRGPAVYPISIIFLLISTTAVCLRLYARLFIRKWFGLDDVFIIMGWVGRPLTELI